MNITDFEKGKTSRLFWPVLGLVVAAVVTTAKQQDPSVLAVGVLLGIVSVYPFYFWLINWSRGIPAWPLFCAITGLTAAMPMFQDTQNLSDYTPMEISTGGMTMTGFILLGTIVWLSLGSRQQARPATILMVSRVHAERYLLGFLALGVAYQISGFTGWLQLPGNLMQVVRGLTGALSTAAIFTLAFQHGRGALRAPVVVCYLAMTTLTVCFILTSLLLAQAIVPVALAIFGYALGKGNFPWKAAAGCLVALALLQPGKYQMRERYWGGESGEFVTIGTIPTYFTEWIGYGIEAMGVNVGLQKPLQEDKSAMTLFERSGTLHMLLLVQQKSPNVVPFMNGATYEPIPRLLLPRFIDDQKGISHAGNVMLTVNYGLQTLEQTASTSIHWGLVPEAYANFGYVGVAALAIVLGAFYAFVGNMTEGVPLTSLRFVLGILIMGAASRADTMGVFVTTQFQGIVGACLGAALLMTRQPNPLAGRESPPVRGAYGSERPRKEEGRCRTGAVGRGVAEEFEREKVGGVCLEAVSPRLGSVFQKDSSSGEEQRCDVEEMRARLGRIYGANKPLPRWAAFRHRAIMLEIERFEAQVKATHGSRKVESRNS